VGHFKLGQQPIDTGSLPAEYDNLMQIAYFCSHDQILAYYMYSWIATHFLLSFTDFTGDGGCIPTETFE
jgi:hypothetical protein